MSDTPLYDATLAGVLARAARRVEVAERGRAQAELELERALRLERVRTALIREQVEEEVRASLALAAPALVDLDEPAPAAEDEPTAPPIPAFADLRTSSKRIDAFFDTLIGS